MVTEAARRFGAYLLTRPDAISASQFKPKTEGESRAMTLRHGETCAKLARVRGYHLGWTSDASEGIEVDSLLRIEEFWGQTDLALTKNEGVKDEFERAQRKALSTKLCPLSDEKLISLSIRPMRVVWQKEKELGVVPTLTSFQHRAYWEGESWWSYVG